MDQNGVGEGRQTGMGSSCAPKVKPTGFAGRLGDRRTPRTGDAELHELSGCLLNERNLKEETLREREEDIEGSPWRY